MFLLCIAVKFLYKNDFTISENHSNKYVKKLKRYLKILCFSQINQCEKITDKVFRTKKKMKQLFKKDILSEFSKNFKDSHFYALKFILKLILFYIQQIYYLYR